MTTWNPDAVVLGGGGMLGEAWMMGLLAGLEDGAELDIRSCEHFVGTSAGAIVAAQLAAGRTLRRPGPEAIVDHEAGAARRATRSWLGSAACAPLVLGLANPGGAAVRAALLRRLGEPENGLDRLRAYIERECGDFDGRLRVVAVDRATGRRVVFGSPHAPATSVADAVTASCTVPWRFAPVTIDGRQYVDGAVWSPTNLDLAPVRHGSRVLCLNPIARLRGGARIDMFRRVSCSAAWVEALGLRRRGASVQIVSPDGSSAAAMGIRLMEHGKADAVLSAGYRQGLALAGWLADSRPRFRPRFRRNGRPHHAAAAVAARVAEPERCSSIQSSSSNQRS